MAQCTEECSFCSTPFHGKRHTHKEKFSSALQEFVADQGLQETYGSSCVCRACEVSAKECMTKMSRGELFRPRWLSQKEICCAPSCSHSASILRHSFSWQSICDSCAVETTVREPMALPLCTTHYQGVYRRCKAKVPVLCCVCGVKRKHEHSGSLLSKFVACPSPRLVESYLRETVDFEATIEEEDVLCFRCYKYFSKLLKNEKCLLTSDHVLIELRAKGKELADIVCKFDAYSKDDAEEAVRQALYRTALHACTILTADQAFLFPEIYKFFVQLLPINIGNAASISKSRLLTFIGHEFGDLLSCYCSNNKIGKVFHRTKADVHVLLSNALKSSSTSQNIITSEQLRDSVQKLVKHLLESQSDQSESLVLDVDAFLDTVCTVAPDLWKHVQILTQSVNESKGRRTAVAKNSNVSKIKQLRRAYLVSVILFISNSECSFPFHAILADAVKSNGGSITLMIMLNRVGAIASIDTLKRIITSISQIRKELGVQDLLIREVFTAATVDNVDFLLSNAAVYSGVQHRSWHAISIQLVQFLLGYSASSSLHAPLLSDPLSKLRALLSLHRRPTETVAQLTDSPKPKKWRARTFSENSILAGRQSEEALTPLVRSAASLPPSSECSVQFCSFLPSSSENNIAEEVKELLFDYFFLKEACREYCSTTPSTLIDLKSFCGQCLDKPELQLASNVVYLSIVDMHADSREGMEAVVSKLHHEYGVGERADHLVVVGDQKTYSRLQELKHIYGSDLSWLVPFIGDWHLLLNY